MLKAIINGRGDEALELARTNLRRWTPSFASARAGTAAFV